MFLAWRRDVVFGQTCRDRSIKRMAAPRSLLLSSSPTISDAATCYTASTGECGDLGICGKVALLDDLISAGEQ